MTVPTLTVEARRFLSATHARLGFDVGEVVLMSVAIARLDSAERIRPEHVGEAVHYARCGGLQVVIDAPVLDEHHVRTIERAQAVQDALVAAIAEVQP